LAFFRFGLSPEPLLFEPPGETLKFSLNRREGSPAKSQAPELLRKTRTYLYGPAVCCKPDVSDGGIGLAHLYPAHE
jgi:hypothetical protein